MDSDFPVLLPALRRVHHLRGMRLLNVKLSPSHARLHKSHENGSNSNNNNSGDAQDDKQSTNQHTETHLHSQQQGDENEDNDDNNDNDNGVETKEAEKEEEEDDNNEQQLQGTDPGKNRVAQSDSFEPVDTYVKIKFVTKLSSSSSSSSSSNSNSRSSGSRKSSRQDASSAGQCGEGASTPSPLAFQTGTFEFLTAPEYATICPCWHLNLASSFSDANALWTSTFDLEVMVRPSIFGNHADKNRGSAASSRSLAGTSPDEEQEPDDAPRPVSDPSRRIVQMNPHTEKLDDEFVNSKDAVYLYEKPIKVDMSLLVFLPGPKWADIVQHAQTNTVLYLLDDGGGRERWYCDRSFGLHLYKHGVLGRVNMRDPMYSLQHQEEFLFDRAQSDAFQAFLHCLSCQREIAAVDTMRKKATQIIEGADHVVSDVARYRQKLQRLDAELGRQTKQLRQEQQKLASTTSAYKSLLKLTKDAAYTIDDFTKGRQTERTQLSPEAGGVTLARSSPQQPTRAASDRALREKLISSQHLLYARKLRLVAQLRQIYPITERREGTLTINGVELPNSNLREFKGGEECICAALGYVGHLVMMLGKYLETSLFFPVKTAGSRSTILTSRREYPLYRRGINDPNDFEYAVKLLKRNIHQLLLAAGIQPPYGRQMLNADGAGILSSLRFLMKHIFT